MKRSLVGAWRVAATSFAIWVCFSTSIASATYTTTFGISNGFVEPTLWSVGDADSTYQEWNWKTTLTGNAPDAVNPRGLSFSGSSYDSPGSPTHGAHGPFFNAGMGVFAGSVLSASHNFYGLDIGVAVNPPLTGGTANIFNYGVSDPGEGTHVLVQTGSTLNGLTGNVPGTLRLVDIATGLPILGGDNASATITQTNVYNGTIIDIPDQGPTAVDYEELSYQFFLPNYAGNFRVEWDQAYSTSIDTLRVDTFIGPQFIASTPVPEPASAVAWMLMFGTIGLVRRKRRRNAGTRSRI